jgi:hypothetical protein
MSPFTTASYGPMYTVNIDTIGPFPADEQGNKYVIVIIDAFSCWNMLIPTVMSAAYALIQWMGFLGIPSNVVSDNGTHHSSGKLSDS